MIYRAAVILIALCAGLFTYERYFNDAAAERKEHAEPVHTDKSMITIAKELEPTPHTTPVVVEVVEPEPLPDNVARDGEIELTFKGGNGEDFRAFISRDQTNVFLQGTLAFLDERRKSAHASIERGIDEVFTGAFADKDASVEAFADWFFGWGESWNFLYQAAKGAVSELMSLDQTVIMDQAKVAMEKHLLTHYSNIVLKPEIRDPKIVKGVEDVLRRAHADYLQAVNSLDKRVVDFIGDNARYVEHITAENAINLKLDWDAQKWKAPRYRAEKAALAGAGGLSMIAAGGMLGPSIEAAFATAAAELSGEVLVASEATIAGAVLGSEIPFIGTLIGAGFGAVADYGLSQIRETMDRDDFLDETHEGLSATISEWKSKIDPKLKKAVAAWYYDASKIVATPNLEEKLDPGS